MPDLKVIDSDNTTVAGGCWHATGDKSNQDRRLKNKERRQRQRERKNAWKLEQSELENQLERLKDSNSVPPKERQDTYGKIAKFLVFTGVVLLTLAEIGISISYGYMQGNEDVPAWIGTLNKWLPVTRNLGGICAMLGLPTLAKASWPHALVAWPLYVLLGYWSLTNNHGWTHTTSTNATIERTRGRQAELEAQKGIPDLEQRWKDAKRDKERAELDASTACREIPGGTKCNRLTNRISEAGTKVDDAWKEYSGARKEVESQTKQETTPVAASQALWINTILPLIGGILLKVVSK